MSHSGSGKACERSRKGAAPSHHSAEHRADCSHAAKRMAKRRIIYVQYTNPAGYPPLEHSSRILADRGWEVLFLGTGADGAGSLAFPPHPLIRAKRFELGGPGWRQKTHYLAYAAWVLAATARFRPAWLYASDPLACPVALMAKRALGVRVLYHEHDSPEAGRPRSRFMDGVLAARLTLAREAEICLLPQEQRLRFFEAATRRKEAALCVWNCPRREEVGLPKARPTGPLELYYHGSLNEKRLPLTVIEALSRASTSARLTVVGYETAGHRGYMESVLALSRELGLGDRVRYLGVLPRRDCLHTASAADVGLAFMPMTDRSANLSHMVGASNKPFDYLARGLMLIVSDSADWREMFVATGLGHSCDPGDADKIAQLIRWCEANREAVHAMGRRGQERVAGFWNYETQFEPVRDRLEQEVTI